MVSGESSKRRKRIVEAIKKSKRRKLLLKKRIQGHRPSKIRVRLRYKKDDE